MKIAIIIRKLNIRGGVQRHVLYLARELKKLSHNIKLYTFIYDKENCYPELLNDMEVVALGFLPQPGRIKALGYVNYFIGLAREARAAKKLAGLIDRDTEVLNPHDHACYKVAYFFKRRINNIPSVWTMHDLPTKSFSLVRERALHPNLKISSLKKFFYQLADWYDIKKYISAQDAIAVLDNRDKEWVKKYFAKDAFIVRNGVDAQKFPFKAREPLLNRKARLFMNGIFMPHRRFEDGIQAVKLLVDQGYDARVEIAGDYGINDKYYASLLKLAHDLGLRERVRFLGRVSEQDLIKKYEESDIFLFPNHLQSWGLAVFEAMATGLPVIVSKSAGAAEVLRDRENALLVEPKSPGDIAQSIQELISNAVLYSDLSRNGRKFVEANISWSRLANDMIKILDL